MLLQYFSWHFSFGDSFQFCKRTYVLFYLTITLYCTVLAANSDKLRDCRYLQEMIQTFLLALSRLRYRFAEIRSFFSSFCLLPLLSLVDNSAMSERSPLLASQQAQADTDRIRAESAISLSLDPNASAFDAFREPIQEEDNEGDLESVVVKEEPMRSDLIIVLAALWIGTFISALDATVVATTLSVIGSEFKVSKSISWVGTSVSFRSSFRIVLFSQKLTRFPFSF